MFPILARANGLDPSAVTWINVTPQLRETLLVRGQTDATTALITDLAGLERLGITTDDLNIMRYSDFGVRLYGHCLLTTPELAAPVPRRWSLQQGC
jgi:NitT/TauT family transport system substrate-binding protein